MKRIFISYRHDDAAGHAGRLYDHLVERFGPDGVFMDVDTIPPGEHFDTYIDDVLHTCYMCIVVIGRAWNIQRLGIDGDYVKKEIAVAFSQNIRIVPALFDDAMLPKPDELPNDIIKLAQCQAYDFTAGRDFKRQVTLLLADVDRAIKEAKLRETERARESLRGLALRPHQYPIWVLSICSLVVLSFIISLNTVPTYIHALANLWLAESADANANHMVAASRFREVLSEIPDSREAKLGLSIALFASNSPGSVNEALDVLKNVKLEKNDWDRLTAVMPAKYNSFFESVKKR